MIFVDDQQLQKRAQQRALQSPLLPEKTRTSRYIGGLQHLVMIVALSFHICLFVVLRPRRALEHSYIFKGHCMFVYFQRTLLPKYITSSALFVCPFVAVFGIMLNILNHLASKNVNPNSQSSTNTKSSEIEGGENSGKALIANCAP